MYRSTRNKNIKRKDTLAVIEGIASDGGLYFLPNIGKIKIDIEELLNLSECGMSARILSSFLPSFDYYEMLEIVKKAYAGKFDDNEIAPCVKVSGHTVVELFHGPTCAFKDVALSVLPHILTACLKKEGIYDEIVILTATSGDTGKAALEGFKDIEGTKIMVFFPENGVSAVQKKQMVSQEGKNVIVCGINGNFDDAQTGIKNIFGNASLKKAMRNKGKRFSSANSINIARLCPQIMYYFKAYSQLIKSGEIKMWDKVNFAVPTGNFGNILAGVIAAELGLPVNKFICASNENNVLTDFINTGIYDKNRKFIKTASPSMDILVSSNLERLLYLLSKDDSEVAGYMEKLNTVGRYEVSDALKKKIKDLFAGYYLTDEECFAQIKETFERDYYLADTHTAVAIGAVKKFEAENGVIFPTVIISTASPYKFADSVSKAIGIEAVGDEFETMKLLSAKTKTKIPKPLAGLEKKKVLHKNICEKDAMLDFVKESLEI